MKRIALVLISVVTLAACAPYSVRHAPHGTTQPSYDATKKITFFSVECKKEVRGGSDEKFHYGDSFLKAKAKSNAGINTEFRIELKPDSGYENSMVTTKCVSSTPAGTDCTWLNKSQQESISKYMIFCVPDSVPLGASFKYEITVPTIGVLDPRIDVTW